MRTVFLVALWAAVYCAVIPINGQTASKNAGTEKAKTGNPQSPKIDAVNVDTVKVTKLNVPQQAEAAGKSDKKGKESKSYPLA